jgi:hypothetical protein
MGKEKEEIRIGFAMHAHVIKAERVQQVHVPGGTERAVTQ